MIEIKIDNLFVVQNQIERLGQGLDDNRYLLMRKLSETMRAAVNTNFRQGGRPKWLGLKYRNGKPLVDGGRLRDSVVAYSDNDTALVGTNMVYAAIHNFDCFDGCRRHRLVGLAGHCAAGYRPAVELPPVSDFRHQHLPFG